MMKYEVGIEPKAGARVVACWRQGLGDVCRVIMIKVDPIDIKWQGRKIVGVLGGKKAKQPEV